MKYIETDKRFYKKLVKIALPIAMQSVIRCQPRRHHHAGNFRGNGVERFLFGDAVHHAVYFFMYGYQYGGVGAYLTVLGGAE